LAPQPGARTNVGAPFFLSAVCNTITILRLASPAIDARDVRNGRTDAMRLTTTNKVWYSLSGTRAWP
jgi:hypothetical protein